MYILLYQDPESQYVSLHRVYKIRMCYKSDEKRLGQGKYMLSLNRAQNIADKEDDM